MSLNGPFHEKLTKFPARDVYINTNVRLLNYRLLKYDLCTNINKVTHIFILAFFLICGLAFLKR